MNLWNSTIKSLNLREIKKLLNFVQEEGANPICYAVEKSFEKFKYSHCIADR
jgi:hypothetical protein